MGFIPGSWRSKKQKSVRRITGNLRGGGERRVRDWFGEHPEREVPVLLHALGKNKSGRERSAFVTIRKGGKEAFAR